MLRHKRSFLNSHFLDSGYKKWQKVLRHWRQNQWLPFQNLFILLLSWVTFLLVSVLWIVWTWDCCFFVGFLMPCFPNNKDLFIFIIQLLYNKVIQLLYNKVIIKLYKVKVIQLYNVIQLFLQSYFYYLLVVYSAYCYIFDNACCSNVL